ncbi:MAG: hypothetical protein ACXW1C_03170 [Gallionella sp.]
MKKLLIAGLVDAAGFSGGALLGLLTGKLLGADVFATGYSNASMVGILLCGLGGGAGVQLARWALRKTEGGRT